MLDDAGDARYLYHLCPLMCWYYTFYILFNLVNDRMENNLRFLTQHFFHEIRMRRTHECTKMKRCGRWQRQNTQIPYTFIIHELVYTLHHQNHSSMKICNSTVSSLLADGILPDFFFSFPYFFILLNFYVPHWLVLSYYNAKWWIWPCTQSRWWCGDCGYSAHSRPTGSFVPQHRRWPSAQQHTNAQFYSEYERTGNSSESSEKKNTSGE